MPTKHLRSTLRFIVVVVLSALFSVAAMAQQMTCIDPASKQAVLRIVNGERASPERWPFIVSLWSEEGDYHFCGGSVINSTWIATAGHCVVTEGGIVDPASFSVRQSMPSGAVQGAGIMPAAIFVHPQYSTDPILSNDVALIKLSQPIDISNNELVMLPTPAITRTTAPDNTCLEVAGWGVVDADTGAAAETLQDVDIAVIDTAACAGSYPGLNNQAHVCAGFIEGGKDSCQGDSGGPLIARDGPTGFILIGIVSFGIGCAVEGFPGIYANVSSYRDWIFSVVEAN